VADPAALAQALVGAGGRASLAPSSRSRAAAYARARLAVPRWRIDHPAVKFLLFPLVPALPAFRLHQHIAFGGTFGEYYTFGLQAYLLALFIWWASWANGLVLFAAMLRAITEAGTLLAIAARPERAIAARTGLERLGRLLFYVGVPAWLLVHVAPW
jgi:apolipoprotein N-acyltransferase